ncbi:MAG: RNA polymerase sigma factor [Solirubrobacteraceae bacterium]
MDDERLLAQTARGDAEAFAMFYRRHLGLVIAFGMRATGDPELAADLAGEVFAVALGSCGRYRAQHDSAAPWLIGIAHNKLRESRRRGRVQDAVRRRLQIHPLALEDEDLLRVEELAALGDGAIAAAVERLPHAERDAVRARIVDERDYGELAAELQCSESVVRQRVSRGLARVRARVAQPETKQAGS